MARTRASKKRKRAESISAVRNVIIVLAILGLAGFAYYKTTSTHRDLDETTLCPLTPDSLTVLLVDVTDPMNLPQRQDFFNELDKLIQQVPRYGKLAIVKVDPISNQLLQPVITRCNPGRSGDVSEFSGNPSKLESMYREQYVTPLKAAFEDLATASSAPRSPILESIQSINLTELQRAGIADGQRRIVVASDLLQHTADVSFYGRLPDPQAFTESPAFNRVRTDLRDTDVELWMLRRDDATRTQPRDLVELWQSIIHAQGGRLVRVYTVSG